MCAPSHRNSRLTLSFVFGASFLAAIPRVLADVYHSLGSQLPEALLAVLPADFFSDESVSKDSISPSAPSAGRSVSSLGSCGRNQLQNLRDRPAHQRRWGQLRNHPPEGTRRWDVGNKVQ